MKGQQLPEPDDSLLEQINQTTLPGNVEELVGEYDETVGIRDPFLWKWLYYMFPEIRLSCVPDAFDQTVRDGKLLASMYVVLVDDVAEVEADEPTFQEISKVPFPDQVPDISRSGVDSEVVELATRIWECVETVVRTGPRSDSFRDLLIFDVHQTISAIWHSYLVNQHLELASIEESLFHDSSNMMLFPYVDLDLIYSWNYDESDLATLRRVVRRAQQMARLGNWITTWERELKVGDLSSGVIVYALENDVVSREQLLCVRNEGEERDAVEQRIHEADIEELFLRRWFECHREIRAYESSVRTVDVDSFLDGLETVLLGHLASRGFK